MDNYFNVPDKELKYTEVYGTSASLSPNYRTRPGGNVALSGKGRKSYNAEQEEKKCL